MYRHRTHIIATLGALTLLGCAMKPSPPATGVIHSKQGALRIAFPDATAVQAKNVFLTKAEALAIRNKAGSGLSSRMVTVYVGHRGKRCFGYGFIDTHRVKQQDETLMIVVSPAGHVQAVHMLAFHDTPGKKPSNRWLGQFRGKALSPRLRLGDEVDGITGATYSANAVTGAVRRALAIYQVVLSTGSRVSCSSPVK